MNPPPWRKTVALGAITGMRSMAGLAALAFRHGGMRSGGMLALAVGEMVADKTPFVAARMAPLPFAGRVVAGAVVGGVIARQDRSSLLWGALVGAAAAATAAHLAYHARKGLRLPNLVGGALEDLVVVSIGAVATQAKSHRTLFRTANSPLCRRGESGSPAVMKPVIKCGRYVAPKAEFAGMKSPAADQSVSLGRVGWPSASRQRQPAWRRLAG